MQTEDEKMAASREQLERKAELYQAYGATLLLLVYCHTPFRAARVCCQECTPIPMCPVLDN